MSAIKKGLPASKHVQKLVGYSLAICIAVVILLVFFWILITAYDLTLIVDSDTHVTFQQFFNVLYSVFVLILGFAVFPPVLYFTLEGICSLRNKKKKVGILQMLSKKSKNILYTGTISYWFLFIVGLFLYFILSFNSPVGK